MKNIYMYQPNYFYGKDAYLPYAIGALAAYAWSDSRIKEKYKLKKLGFARENIENAVANLENPFLCAFSCYTWNYEYNKVLASEIKKNYPDCKIVFGGHQVAANYSNETDLDYIDVVIYDEGEVPFKKLLLAYDEQKDLSEIPNIRYKDINGEWHFTQKSMITETEFPSPYLMGIFDELMLDTSLSFTPTLETNRGCPFSCAYCDWGIYKSKLRQFSMERVKAEIDWFSEHKIDLIFGADSNFGILERDEEIIDYMIEKKKKTGYPRKFRVAYTKNTGERVFGINRKLNIEGMCKGATLSFQSMNKKTLEAVGRKNVPINYFSKLMESYHAENIPTYSEIILGLPEETYETFCDGIDQLLNSGQHTSLSIYLCELLPNSAMGQKEYMERYEIKLADTILNQYHCLPETEGIIERSKIVIGTSVLSFEEWKKMYLFSLVIQTFHCLGLTRYIAMYLHYEYDMKYQNFYQDVLDWCIQNPSTVVGNAFKKMYTIFEQFIEGKVPLTYTDERFGATVWPLEEAWYLEIVYNAKEFYKELGEFLKASYSEIMSQEMCEQLLKYQETITYTPCYKEKEIELKYVFYEYFASIMSGEYKPLKRESHIYKTKIDKQVNSWDEFAVEIVWYGRKGGKNHLRLECKE